MPKGRKVVAYGGGVNSVAVLIQLQRLGVIPTAIVMADPGHEWPETLAHRDQVVRPWCASVGFPDIVVVTRQDELRYRTGGKNYETLGGLCERTASLPSIAYGLKKCSFNYKAAPQRWWVERQAWAQKVWADGKKLAKVIGYDADEDERIRPAFNDDVENAQYVPWYPLWEAEIDRAGCEALILDAGLEVPRASSCFFCPNMRMEEWAELRATHPALFEYAVQMSRRAEATVENVREIGLLRWNPKGQRQLHVWADGGYGDVQSGPQGATPCECAV